MSIETQEHSDSGTLFEDASAHHLRTLDQPASYHPGQRPVIVALLGDDNYAETLQEAARDRTLGHELPLLPVPTARALGLDLSTDADRELLALEMARVAMANYVLVVAPDGYVSPFVAALITHASRLGRPVTWWNWATRAAPVL